MIIVCLLKSGITMLIHNKDDIEFVTEFPCLLGHPVEWLDIISKCWIYDCDAHQDRTRATWQGVQIKHRNNLTLNLHLQTFVAFMAFQNVVCLVCIQKIISVKNYFRTHLVSNYKTQKYRVSRISKLWSNFFTFKIDGDIRKFVQVPVN